MPSRTKPPATTTMITIAEQTEEEETMMADDDWKSSYEELAEYRRRHGHCVVPQRFADNPNLGRWVARQREQHRRLEKGQKVPQMNQWKISQLKKIDFVWYVGTNQRNQVIQKELKANGRHNKNNKKVLPQKNKNKKKQQQQQPSSVANHHKRPATRGQLLLLSPDQIANNKKKQKTGQAAVTPETHSHTTTNTTTTTTTTATELNDHDLELARLIANFPADHHDDDDTSTSKNHIVVSLDSYDDDIYDYSEMNQYLDTIATLQNDICNLQQELLQTKSMTHQVQTEWMMLCHHPDDDDDVP